VPDASTNSQLTLEASSYRDCKEEEEEEEEEDDDDAEHDFGVTNSSRPPKGNCVA
jgi:hypothetical protein